VALREAIFRIFSAAAAGGPPAADDLARLNRALARAPARDRLRRADGGYRWQLDRLTPTAPALLAPVLWSAGDLLAAARLVRVRRCANEQCQWLFLDDSKSGTRRWCSMQSCGNRAKAHRHYLRHKQD
jgi:predicted RNA-binding Zn ribbon-like protein